MKFLVSNYKPILTSLKKYTLWKSYVEAFESRMKKFNVEGLNSIKEVGDVNLLNERDKKFTKSIKKSKGNKNFNLKKVIGKMKRDGLDFSSSCSLVLLNERIQKVFGSSCNFCMNIQGKDLKKENLRCFSESCSKEVVCGQDAEGNEPDIFKQTKRNQCLERDPTSKPPKRKRFSVYEPSVNKKDACENKKTVCEKKEGGEKMDVGEKKNNPCEKKQDSIEKNDPCSVAKKILTTENICEKSSSSNSCEGPDICTPIEVKSNVECKPKEKEERTDSSEDCGGDKEAERLLNIEVDLDLSKALRDDDDDSVEEYFGEEYGAKEYYLTHEYTYHDVVEMLQSDRVANKNKCEKMEKKSEKGECEGKDDKFEKRDRCEKKQDNCEKNQNKC